MAKEFVMTTVHLQVARPAGPAYPFGSRIAAAVYLAAAQALAALARAGRKPTPDAKSPAEEAQAVRELAWEYQGVDPRFAADLRAAADRHERVHGIG
jgi:hypothetical protein